MVHYGAERLDRGFAALADTRRRDMLDRLSRGPAPVSALVDPDDITLAGALKHVRVLEAAGLVVTHKVGRTRMCELAARPLDDVASWIDERHRQWSVMLDRFADHVATVTAEASRS